MRKKVKNIVRRGSLAITPKVFIFIFLAVAGLVILSAAVELTQSKEEMYELMSKQSSALLETLMEASENALKTKHSFENELRRSLLTNAAYIKLLYASGDISDQKLRAITESQNLYRISIFDRNGKHLFSSHPENNLELEKQKPGPDKVLQPVFSGETDTLIIGLREARFDEGYRYAVALATSDGGAVAVSTDAEELFLFRERVGFGVLLNNVVKNEGIIYAALQDSNGILTLAGRRPGLEPLNTSVFLSSLASDTSFNWHIADYDSFDVFEAAAAFYPEGRFMGVFRIGLSLAPVEQINERIYRRVIIISLILIFFGSMLLGFVFLKQNFSLLSKQYSAVEAFSGKIISSVSDAIIVLDSSYRVTLINKAAEDICGLSKTKAAGTLFKKLIGEESFSHIFSELSSLTRIDCKTAHGMNHLLVSRTDFTDEKGENNIVLIMKDLTDLRRLELQMQRRERLSAMGELASGVAHEIRNPLNTIGTIVQQIKKDFTPVRDKEEYTELLSLVYKEVKRINETVEHFLRFARPELIKPERFRLDAFINQLENQYRQVLQEHSIILRIECEYKGDVSWDHNQMRQVFINLLENSIDAIERNGTITIRVSQNSKNELTIFFSDDGSGIEKSSINKIFNLYFTTKAKGTGIGLSIVQRIIYEHRGIMSAESTPGKGTSFTITLPVSLHEPGVAK